MKKQIIMLMILFSFITPLKFAANYVINFGTCIVDYAADWGQLTAQTAKCAWTKATAIGL